MLMFLSSFANKNLLKIFTAELKLWDLQNKKNYGDNDYIYVFIIV